MAKRRVTLIPGDGVGPSLVEAALQVLDAAGAQIEWDRQEAGADVMDKYGTPLPEAVLDNIRENRVAYKGPITTPVGKRVPQRERRAAQGARPVRLRQAGVLHPGRQDAVHATSTWW